MRLSQRENHDILGGIGVWYRTVQKYKTRNISEMRQITAKVTDFLYKVTCWLVPKYIALNDLEERIGL